MPLVIVCGTPSSGKTKRSREIGKYLETKGHKVVIVSDEGITLDDSGIRGQIRSSVEREVARTGVAVICDAANEVRGFRYELHCIAKARSMLCCTVHCLAPEEERIAVVFERNSHRTPTPRTQEEIVDMRRRFEPPTESNKWERPLFVVGWEEEDLLPLEEIRVALFERIPPTPNKSTSEESTSSAAHVHGLDSSTRDVVSMILKAISEPTFVPGDSLSLPQSSRSLSIPRKVSAAELGRLRRQFVRINEASADSISNPVDAFIVFLSSSL